MKKNSIPFLILAALLGMAGCGKNREDKTDADSVAILSDTEFRSGFTVFGKTHEAGTAGKLYPGESKSIDPEWRIAQWACDHNIAEGIRIQKEDGYSYTTESQRVEISSWNDNPSISLELLASKEYSALRSDGEAWPHFLIEQTNLQTRCPMLDTITALNFKIEFRIPYCSETVEDQNPDLHTAQSNLYFTIQDMRSGDMYWFGIPLFDYRYKMQNAFMAEDGGKADASHKFIYIVEQEYFTDRDVSDGDWVSYDADIYPKILYGLKEAKKHGFLEYDDPSRYTLTTMNVGWEMPGTYDAELIIRGLSLTACVRKA